jgi:hypothetical protein
MSTDTNLPDEWSQFTGSGSQPTKDDKQTGLFMRLERRDKPYVVRLVSSPEPFRQHWQAFKPLQARPVISPVFEIADKDKDAAWNLGGWVPTKKYAILVIDREDGRLKIMQGGEQIFGEIKKYIDTQKKRERDPNPIGPNAPDWVITVGVKDGQTHYDCSPDMGGPKPLTPEETKLVSGFNADWRGFFKKTSPEELLAMWEKLPEDKRLNPDPKRKGTLTADAVGVSAPAPQVPVSPTATVSTAPQTQAIGTSVPSGTAQPVIAATTTQVIEPAKLF